MTYRHSANGQSGGRGADIWVILSPKEAAWLDRNVGGSLTVMSVDGEVVRISNFADQEQGSLLATSRPAKWGK